MNDIIAALQDVSALVTRGSDVARTEARRMATQREHKAAACQRPLSDQPAAAAAQVIERIPGQHRSSLLSARVRRLWATGISVCRTAIGRQANDII